MCDKILTREQLTINALKQIINRVRKILTQNSSKVLSQKFNLIRGKICLKMFRVAL